MTDEGDPSQVTRQELEEAARGFVGDLMQVPPMVSAVKIGGVPLYKLARKGKTVERKPRLRHVYEFAILDYRPPHADFRIRCTKGTYVRTLCHDLGIQLGCFAHLHSLRRTASGRLSVDDALGLDEILAMTRDEVRQRLLPLHQATNLTGA